MHTRYLAILVALASATLVFAQGPAPRGKAETAIGGKKITIDYGRPALKGRTEAELMAKLPEDRMWRAGMDQVSTLTTATPLMLGGKKVPAGKYSLYIHVPATGDWSLVLNSVLGQPLKNVWAQAPANLANEPWPSFAYTKEIGEKEVARAPMKKGKAEPPVDLLTIDLKPSADGAMMTLAWGGTSWSIDLQAAK